MYDKDGNLIWDDLFPDGRTIFYEGDKPAEFVAEMKERFNFDPSSSASRPFWKGERKDGRNQCWNEHSGWMFHCPGRCINAVYGSSKYPLGS